MTRRKHCSGISRRSVLSTVAAVPLLSTPLFRTSGWAQGADPLPSWNDGAAKRAIIAFVEATTDTSSPKFVPQEARVAKATLYGYFKNKDALYLTVCARMARLLMKAVEEALTQRFGLEWVARGDGHGFEIKGISGEMMRLFSSRRESITADLRARAERFEQRYGRRIGARPIVGPAERVGGVRQIW